MKLVPALPILFLLTLASAALPRLQAEGLAARVVILANRDDADSLRIARHYASARSVPVANIVALPFPTTETISWREFIPQVWEPVMAELVRAGWIDAIPMNLTDPVGRRKYAVSGHRIAALVVCRGVPLRIAHEPSLYSEVLPFTRRNEFRTNAGAVDAELSLLALPQYPINAFVPNPLFQNERPSAFELSQVIKVSRLDGPTAEDALALVDHALAAERDGLLGRGYVDLGDYDPEGNAWLDATARELAGLGFETSVDRLPATLPATARIDAPVLYFGWYAGDLNGPFALPGFRFPPGAIALHIHSYSAATLRSATSGWTGPFVARGVTATVGNVYEPYLQFTHRPNLLLHALARGANWVDAAYFSLQALSWQQVIIGDPLYRPFAVSNEEQMRRFAQLPPALAGYAALRRSQQLETAGRRTDALEILRQAQRDRPSLAGAFALAQRLHTAHDDAAAATALEPMTSHTEWRANEWALGREAALLLAQCGAAQHSLEIWQRLLGGDRLPASVREAWLPEAIAAARAVGDASRADAWQAKLTALRATAK